ncbi:uncharacterized protein K441DRAFT_427745, partial [Cenococcum geophilum 1.58]|uniref:uncharacterized protein n=1 Tax=Cenococcum geophilum 1.58 TaxID=794803 RepID=UPI003590241E
KQAFNKLKKRLVSAPLLSHFNLERPLILETDALDSIIAKYPIAYYLKTIINAKLNYLIHNKEILAIISSF